MCPHVAFSCRCCSARYSLAAIASSSDTASPFPIFLNASSAVLPAFHSPPTLAIVVMYGTKFRHDTSPMALQKSSRSPRRFASIVLMSWRPRSVFSSCSRDMVLPNTLADFT